MLDMVIFITIFMRFGLETLMNNETLKKVIERLWDLNSVNNTLFKRIKGGADKHSIDDLLKKREDIEDEINGMQGEEGIPITLKNRTKTYLKEED